MPNYPLDSTRYGSLWSKYPFSLAFLLKIWLLLFICNLKAPQICQPNAKNKKYNSSGLFRTEICDLYQLKDFVSTDKTIKFFLEKPKSRSCFLFFYWTFPLPKRGNVPKCRPSTVVLWIPKMSRKCVTTGAISKAKKHRKAFWMEWDQEQMSVPVSPGSFKRAPKPNFQSNRAIFGTFTTYTNYWKLIIKLKPIFFRLDCQSQTGLF